MAKETYEIHGQSYVANGNLEQRETWPHTSDTQYQPTLTIKSDDLFLVARASGDIVNPSNSRTVTGLFGKDTRFLSRSELQIEGKSIVVLGSEAETGYSLQVAATNPEIDGKLSRESIGIIRRILLRGGLFEEIEICNYNTRAVQFQLSWSFEADFQDLFEVRQYGQLRPQRGLDLKPLTQPTHGSDRANLTFAYQGLDGVLMASRINFVQLPPDTLEGNTAIWQFHLGSHETQTLGIRLQPLTGDRPTSRVFFPPTFQDADTAARQEQERWFEQITQIRSDRADLNTIVEQAERDIYLLLQSFESGRALAAGIPWFSTLFGRDSLIAAAQTIILDPRIARDTLTILAHYQGQSDSDWHDEDPGKILHELRFGEMARNREIPHTPYYGTVDATPLWLMLYADYYAWSGDRATIEQLWPNALEAVKWIENRCRETGYLSYRKRSSRGIDNQGWKDSGDCIVDRHGQMVSGPIALCEVQGYVYAALMRSSQIARELQHLELSQRWEALAKDLKERFNRDFWLREQEYCALALDGEGNPVDSITSNPGHCLHLGILEPEKADRVARRLRSRDLFSGWGIRTLSSLSPAYNPIGYHLGSVWPHDNALIATGLRSLGYIDQSFAIAKGLFDAIEHQPQRRPPELFCGYERRGKHSPIPYPVACSPQAWATGSIFQLLQTMANPIPDAINNTLTIRNPALPDHLNTLSVRNLKVGNSRIDLEFERTGKAIACRTTKHEGDLRVIIET